MQKIETIFIGGLSFLAVGFLNLFQNTSFTDLITGVCQLVIAGATVYKILNEKGPKRKK